MRERRRRRPGVEPLESRQLLTTINDSFALTSHATPWGITAGPDGKLWFTDSGSIQSPGSFQVQSITPGASNPNQAITVSSSPQGIVSAAGKIWFTELGIHNNPDAPTAIGEIDPATSHYSHFPVPTQFSGPISITYDPDNGLIYFTEAQAGKIGTLNPATGAISDNITLSNAGSNPQPTGIMYNPVDHKIWFVEPMVNAIGVYDPANPTSPTPIPLAGASASAHPTAMTLGSDGNLWIAESGTGQFQMYNPVSKTFSQVYSLPASSGNAGAPIWGITSGPDGNIYLTVAGSSQGQIAWFNPSTLVAAGSNYSQDITVLNTPNSVATNVGSKPFGITSGPDGNVWFVEQDGRNGIGAVGVAILDTHIQIGVSTQPPASVAAGSPFDVTVHVTDANGAPFEGPVTVSLANNPGGGTLGGTVTVRAVNGVANFPDLRLDKAGNGYSLLVSLNPINGVTASTSAFNVTGQSGGGNNGGGNNGGGNNGGGNNGGGNNGGTSSGSSSAPTVVTETLVTYRKTNKKGKPIGKPLTEVVLTFSTAMQTVGSAGDYQVFWDSTKRVKKQLKKIPHRAAVVAASPGAGNTTVNLMTTTPLSKFSKGWQVTIVSPASIVGTDGVALGGPTTFQH